MSSLLGPFLLVKSLAPLRLLDLRLSKSNTPRLRDGNNLREDVFDARGDKKLLVFDATVLILNQRTQSVTQANGEDRFISRGRANRYLKKVNWNVLLQRRRLPRVRFGLLRVPHEQILELSERGIASVVYRGCACEVKLGGQPNLIHAAQREEIIRRFD